MPKTKADLVQKLAELYKQLGEAPKLLELVDRHSPPCQQLRRDAEELVRKLKQQEQKGNRQASENDARWFEMGGTRD